VSAEDTTTADQRSYWHVMHCMLAEAKRPATGAEMRDALRDLRREAGREAKHLQVPYEDWHDEVALRLRRLMQAMCLPLPRLAQALDDPASD